MSTSALNSLWTYIESLTLSSDNRKWLAEKLLEPTANEMDEETRKDEEFMKLVGAWANDPLLDNIEDVIMESRQSGVTRHVMDFDEV